MQGGDPGSGGTQRTQWRNRIQCGGSGEWMEVNKASWGGQVRGQWRPMGVHGAGGQGLVRTNVIAGAAAAMPIGRLQCQDLEGSERGGARLRGNHAPEASHGPRAHVIVVGTDWGARGGK